MSALDPLRSTLAAQRNSSARLRTKLEQVFDELAATADEEAKRTLGAEVDALRSERNGQRTREGDGVARELDPRQWMQELDGNVPILLFPLRIQTRFLNSANGRTLLVRVFPDDISVQSHDPALTLDEQSLGDQLWAAPDESDDPEVPTQREIWRGIAARIGLRRAAWIRQATDPAAAAPPQVVNALARIPAVWTLPERLIFRLYGQGDLLLAEVPGNPIADGLEMGFDPTRTDLGFARADGDFEYPPELAWQVDFDVAVKAGMAVSLPFGQIGNVARIERLVVLGVRLASDEAVSQQLLERLFDDHRFGDGFSILPQGTPTNVTQDGDVPAAPDADAMFTWLRGDGAYADGGKKTLYEDEGDGLRLAHALGVSPDVMRYVERADQRDASEAIAMKRALWAGTLGYYAQQMLWPLFEDSFGVVVVNNLGERLTLATRFYFTHFVFGRGPLPAIRVGDQPYGILPVSGDTLKADAARVPAWNEAFLDGFTDLLHGKLLILARSWLDAIPRLSRAGAGAGADARLVDVLGLQAGAVEYHSERLIGKEYLKNYVDFKARGATPFAEYEGLLDARFAEFAARFPTLFASRPKIFDLTFFGGYWKQIVGDVGKLDRNMAPLLTGDVIDDLPYSESRTIADAYPNYIAQFATLDFAAVRHGLTRVKNGATAPVTALLYLLARHSYLYEHAFTAMRLHRHFQNRQWREFRERELYNTLFQPDPTYWDTLETPARWPALGLGASSATALKLIASRDDLRAGFPDWKMFFGDVDELHRSLTLLAGLPTARLERLFAEHLDLAGYRLDAWLTGFVYQRLLALRAWRQNLRANRVHPAYPGFRDGPLLRYDLNHRPLDPYATGIYLGAYGWVEGIEPDPVPTPVADLPADLTPKNGRPVTRDADNYGLIHAPSLNQATTAALLRAASVTEPDKPAFNIDLSSARVRDALWIIEGVRNGQTPAALLGYKFERGLRDRDVTLLQYLPALRDAFPMPRPLEPDGSPAEAISAKNVVNGLRLIQARRDGTLAVLVGSFIANAGDRHAVTDLAAAVLDTLDACSDLMLAESVHQGALGNYDRAGGVVTAAGEFTHVPDEFEVIRTPRSGTSITHRVLIAMNDDAAAPAPRTVRARLAPALNAWIGRLLGPLAQIVCGVAYVTRAGGAEQRARYAVTLDDLDLEPMDLLYVLDDTTVSELAERVVLLTRARFDAEHPAAEVDHIELETFAAGAAGARAVGELVPLIAQLRKLLAGARPATQRDFVAPNVLHWRSPAAIDAIDQPELLGRVIDLRDAFVAAMAALGAAGALDVNGLRALLLDAAKFGIPQAVPDALATLDDHHARVEQVRVIMQTRLDAADALWTPPGPPAGDALRVLGEVATTLLGAAFPLLPRIELTDDVAAAALAPGAPSPERVDDWLFLASTVRENAARLQHVRVLAAATVGDLPPMQLFQWPSDHKDWIAEPAAVDATLVRDYLSIVVQPDDDALDVSKPLVGFVVDEWHELIPNETETTGITFHYDAPNAEPPQALLLAVAERRQASHGNWSWDELVACVDQALTLAKMRVVGPDELRHTELDAVLPATLAAEAATPATIATSFLANISDTIALNGANVWSKI